MKSLVVRVAAVALAISTLPGAAHADWVAGAGGSALVPSVPVPGGQSGTADGVVNFAVWKNSGTVGVDNLFTQLGITAYNAAGTLGTSYQTAKYAYIYQVVNTSYPTGLEDQIEGFFVQVKTANVSGVAVAGTGAAGSGYVLTETLGVTDTKVGPTSNQRLGGESTVAPNTVGNASGVVGDTGAFTTAHVGTNTIKANFNNFPDGSGDEAVRFTFGTGDPNSGLLTNEYTTLLIITSNFDPGYAGGALQDGGNAMGFIVTPGGNGPLVDAPEPSTFGLIALAIPLVGFGYARRLRKNLSAQVATMA